MTITSHEDVAGVVRRDASNVVGSGSIRRFDPQQLAVGVVLCQEDVGAAVSVQESGVRGLSEHREPAEGSSDKTVA